MLDVRCKNCHNPLAGALTLAETTLNNSHLPEETMLQPFEYIELATIQHQNIQLAELADPKTPALDPHDIITHPQWWTGWSQEWAKMEHRVAPWEKHTLITRSYYGCCGPYGLVPDKA